MSRQLRLAPAVESEIGDLRARGIDVNVVFPKQTRTNYSVVDRVDAIIAEVEGGTLDACRSRLFDETDHPANAAWWALAKRAIALQPIYDANLTVPLGHGFSMADFELPLFSDRSALNLITDRYGKARAEGIMQRYRRFIADALPLDARTDEDGLRDGDYMFNVLDARAVRSRAVAAMDRIISHFEGGKRKELTSASLACGAAGPVFELAVKMLDARRANPSAPFISQLVLVDQDPMALASAFSLARRYELDRSEAFSIKYELRDLLIEDINSYISPQSVDIVDLLGFFEYIPYSISPTRELANKLRRGKPTAFADREPGTFDYPAAAEILSHAGSLVAPGGILVFGNMLSERPGQRFFDMVWPPLQQRSVTATLQIIKDAGLDPKNVSVDIPGEEGVYAIYTVRFPSATKKMKLPPGQKAARYLTKRMLKY